MKSLLLALLLLVSSITLASEPKRHIRFTENVDILDLVHIEPRLLEVMATIAEFCSNNNVTFMITSISRDKQRNREVGASSLTHVEYRAFDFSIQRKWGWNDKLLSKLEDHVETKHWQYGQYSPTGRQKVLLYHKVTGGALHAHVQVVRKYTFIETMNEAINYMLKGDLHVKR